MIKIHRKEENGKYTLFDEQGDIFYITAQRSAQGPSQPAHQTSDQRHF